MALVAAAREQLLSLDRFPVQLPAAVAVGSDVDQVRFIVRQCLSYWEAVKPVAEAVVAGCGWGVPEQNPVWTRSMQSVARTVTGQISGDTRLLELRHLALLPVLYGGALAAVHRDRFHALQAITIDAETRNLRGERLPVISDAHVWLPFESDELLPQALVLQVESGPVATEVIAALRVGRKPKRYTPVSDTLMHLLRDLLSPAVVDPEDYEDLFDRTEVLLALIATDEKVQAHQQGKYRHGAWFGRYTWRHRYAATPIEETMRNEFSAAGSDWGPIRGGLFGGSPERAAEAFEQVLSDSAAVRSRHH